MPQTQAQLKTVYGSCQRNFNGAAIINANGEEIPMTESMIDQLLDTLCVDFDASTGIKNTAPNVLTLKQP